MMVSITPPQKTNEVNIFFWRDPYGDKKIGTLPDWASDAHKAFEMQLVKCIVSAATE